MKRSCHVVVSRVTIALVVLVLLAVDTCASFDNPESHEGYGRDDTIAIDDENEDGVYGIYDVHDVSRMDGLEERLYNAKMELWSRGEFDTMAKFSNDEDEDDSVTRRVERMEEEVRWSSVRLGPVREVRREYKDGGGCIEFDCHGDGDGDGDGDFRARLLKMRGGASTGSTLSTSEYNERLKAKIDELSIVHGSEFIAAIQRNEEEHAEDCETSCHSFYCKSQSRDHHDQSDNAITTDNPLHQTTAITSYSFGPTPPEDFAEKFGFPLDLIKVTSGTPIIPPQEAKDVLSLAIEDGIEHNEYTSGKYKLGGDWLLNLPKTRAWFNTRLENTFFPLLAHLFPEIISSPTVLRAHSVSLLKYNYTHPRTDVHIDNGILAMTIAMTPLGDYIGGGTFFEHMGVDNVLQMDVGHGTFRPGSIRHGGHRVTGGTRYILGAFLLITDRVEHVRRLKNRGSALRRQGDKRGAEKLFQWALDINPKCSTCLKDWAEILVSERKYTEAESKVRAALELLEERDSDCLFNLGVILSEQGREQESIDAYQKSYQLNDEDAQLCYNLGIKLGAKGDVKGEMKMYARATSIDPSFGGAWLNWGTAFAESGDIDNAEVMFLKGLSCPEVAPKAMINLALVYEKKANALAATGDLNGAKAAIENAVQNLESAKPLLDDAIQNNSGDNTDEEQRYVAQFQPLRLACHRMMGSIFAGMKDLDGCEREFRLAVQNFPDASTAWQMLARILQLQGKTEEASQALEKLKIMHR